jgi:hypothetical protein
MGEPAAVFSANVTIEASPQAAAGMRKDPPASLPWARGTSPAATAAADPPDEPPIPLVGSMGFTTGEWASGSHEGSKENSEQAEVAMIEAPVRRMALTKG